MPAFPVALPHSHLLTRWHSFVQTPGIGMLSAASMLLGQQLCNPDSHIHGFPCTYPQGKPWPGSKQRAAPSGSLGPIGSNGWSGAVGTAPTLSEEAKQAVAFHQRRPAKKTLFPQMCSSFKIIQAKVSIVLWPLLII